MSNDIMMLYYEVITYTNFIFNNIVMLTTVW